MKFWGCKYLLVDLKSPFKWAYQRINHLHSATVTVLKKQCHKFTMNEKIYGIDKLKSLFVRLSRKSSQKLYAHLSLRDWKTGWGGFCQNKHELQKCPKTDFALFKRMTVKTRNFSTICNTFYINFYNGLSAIFYKPHFFSTQPQCCLTF